MIAPKDLRENILFREKLLTECEKDPIFAGQIREYFAKDILFAFNAFFYTYDPRNQYKNLPFITWDYQDKNILEIDRCIEVGENLFVDKSRDMGVTYMILYVFLWRWLTKKSEEYRIGSRKEDYVDKSGDMDTLFEKLRYCLQRLPMFIKPIGFDLRKHSPYMKLINPEKSNSIIGEATNANFARGGRKKAVLYDEFQTWEEAEGAWRSATDATRCKIAVGTPQGMGNKFAELARTTEVKNKLHLLWYIHPQKAVTSAEYLEKKKQDGKVHKDQSNCPTGCYLDHNGKIRSEWYDKECLSRNAEDVAENLDCDYLTTGHPVFDTEKCNLRKMQAKEPLKIGNLHWTVRPMFDTFGQCTNKMALSVQFVPNINGIYKLWEYPKPDYENGYCISADVAEGLEQGDFDSASAFRRFPLQGQSLLDFKPTKIMTLHAKLKTFEYAEELAKFGVFCGHAWIAPERTGLGLSVVDQLFKYYPKIFHKEIMSKGYPEQTDRLGWDTNSQTKGHVISNLSKHISEETYEDNDPEFWNECLTFVNNDGKMEAQGKSQGQKCYDDRVMDTAIGLWIHKELPLPKYNPRVKQVKTWRDAGIQVGKDSLVGGFVIH